MKDRLYNLMCNIEDFLVSIIDSDETFDKYESVDSYMLAQDPDIYALYTCFQRLADKFFPEEKENN